ncbi:MAG: hypothetical protein ACRDQF_19700, partial [Thermocrispum sp.]
MTTAHIAGPFVRLERDYPHIDWDAYRVRENIQRAQRAVAERTPARYRHATVSNQDIADWVRRLINLAVESHGETPAIRSGPSLLVLGATGTGKTHQIYAAAAAASTAG